MKIALISVNKGDTLPLNLIILAGYLKKYGNFNEIKIIDINVDNIYESILRYKPDIIGISSMTVYYGYATKLAKKLKQNINVPILIGGNHISTLPNCLYDCFDIGIIGEGEITTLEVLKLYEQKKKFETKDLQKINGIAFHKDNQIKLTEPRPLIENLDEIPIPDYRLVSKKYFKKVVTPAWKRGITAPMVTSRGCPYTCVFCSTSICWHKRTRFHSPDYVVEYIKMLKQRFNVDFIYVWDDMFLLNKPRIKEIAEKLKKENLKLNYIVHTRVEVVDDEFCKMLKEMGVSGVQFGFESGSERVLKYLKGSSTSIEKIKKAVLTCKKYGFLVYGSFIFGSPTETIEEMKETVSLFDFLIKADIENVWTYIMTPLPGTKIWEIAKERNKVKDEMDWNDLSFQRIENPLLLDEHISREEFKKIFIEGRKKLQYFRWKKIKRDLIHNPHYLILNAIKKPQLLFQIIKGRLNEEVWAIKDEI
ncbi:MAG: radical SAM protein [Candidatus Nanoarchaeia archaeon]|nr:radical SAM protein [Candidatus Nanoarchaeia archaeon]